MREGASGNFLPLSGLLVDYSCLHARLQPALQRGARASLNLSKLNSVFAGAVGPGHASGKFGFVAASWDREINAERRAEAQSLVQGQRGTAAADVDQRGSRALRTMAHRNWLVHVGAVVALLLGRERAHGGLVLAITFQFA